MNCKKTGTLKCNGKTILYRDVPGTNKDVKK